MFDLVNQRAYKRRFRRQGRRRFTRLQLFSYIAAGGFVLLLAGIFVFGLLFAWYAKDLPRPDRVRRVEGFSTILLDRHGDVLYDIYEDQNRVPVKFEHIPDHVKQATIAIEDKEFYTHEGYSLEGMFRGFSRLIFRGRIEGGSTLTQQLVKNALLTSERTIPRKLKELILSIQIERKFTKDEILQLYLNETPYGGTAYGIEAATNYYFDKNAKDLTLLEGAILAGLPQSPSQYSPFGANPEAYVWRTQQVLRRMREDRHITAEEETALAAQLADVQFAAGTTSFRAPHFVEYVRKLLIEEFGTELVETGGLRVTTTLDTGLQAEAERIVRDEVERIRNLQVSNGAAIVLEPTTGEILAMVGSRDYEATDSAGLKFNVVTQGLRQPGSTLKPITYATAFDQGILTPSSIIMDVPIEFPGGTGEAYEPVNYDDKFRGPVQVRFALANSINIAAVKTIAMTGVENMLETAFAMGLTTLEPTRDNINRFGLSVTLGGGEVRLIELAQAFGVFATGGVRQETVAILQVTDKDGKVLFEQKPTRGRRVLESDVAYLISDILSDNNARREVFGERSHLFIPGHTVAAKTGTTDDKRDNWTIGYTRSAVVGVWVGNNDNSPMHPSLASGITGAAPIFNAIMRQALNGVPNQPFPRPDTIMELEIDAFGGGLPVPDQATRREIFIRGTEPTGPAPIYQKLKISKQDSNRLANEVEIASGNFDEREFIVFSEDDPVSTDGRNRWQEGIDAWLETNPDPKYHPPTQVSTAKSDEVVVNITRPADKARVDDHDVRISAEAFSLGDIRKLTLYINDKEFKTLSSDSFSEVVNLDTGVHEIRVRGEDDRDKSAEGRITIGVFEDVDK